MKIVITNREVIEELRTRGVTPEGELHLDQTATKFLFTWLTALIDVLESQERVLLSELERKLLESGETPPRAH